MKIKSELFIIIIITVFVFNCGKSDETYTIETKDGVNYVNNHAPAWGDKTKVALEFVQMIGGLETMDENYQLYLPRDVAVDDFGNIYIVDAGNYRVQKYDMNGKYLATFGRKGQGPSEFSSPSALSIDSENNILVDDVRIIKVLDQKGKEIKRIKLNPTAGFKWVSSSGNFVTGRTGAGAVTGLQPLLNVFDPQGNHKAEFVEPVDHGNDTANHNENNISFTIDKMDNIYFSFITKNRIEKYTIEGEHLWTMDRKLKFSLIPAKYKVVNVHPDLPPAYSVTQCPAVFHKKSA